MDDTDTNNDDTNTEQSDDSSIESTVENDPLPEISFGDFLVLEAISHAVSGRHGGVHHEGTGIFVKGICDEYGIEPPFRIDIEADQNVSIDDNGNNPDLINAVDRLLEKGLIQEKEEISPRKEPQYFITDKAAEGLSIVETNFGAYVRNKSKQ